MGWKVAQRATALAETVANFAESFTTKELTFDRAHGTDLTLSHQLCIGQTCVTEDQLKPMLAAAGAGSGGSGSPPANDNASPSATLVVNGNNPAEWPLNQVWNDNLAALFTHDGSPKPSRRFSDQHPCCRHRQSPPEATDLPATATDPNTRTAPQPIHRTSLNRSLLPSRAFHYP